MIRTTVPADPVRIHVQDLIDAGMTQAWICRTARTSGAIVNALLHGQYSPGRPPVQSIATDTADRLLAVKFDPAGVRPKTAAEQMCAPGARFEAFGYRIGRCLDCGQIAPVRNGDDGPIMFGHPRPESGAEVGALPAAVAQLHPDCGTPKGHQRHVREKTKPCELCKAARRGYEQGRDAATAEARKVAATSVPRELGEEAVKACRAILYRRPVPQIRELAVQVVRIADAELCDDTRRRAA